MPAPHRPPLRATYRVQLSAGFTFDDAVALVPYLAQLGVSHLYCSPVLQAAPGSTHGYDVIDHSRVSAELGGGAGFERLTDALRAAGMGLVLDIVPNHMSIAAEGNRWWWDVLQHGPASRYAAWFDVDWDPPESRLRNTILLPLLADHYGRVLEAGQIGLARDGGTIAATYGDRRFPLDPGTLDVLVAAAADRAGSAALERVAASLGELPPSTISDPEMVAARRQQADDSLARLAEIVGGDAGAATALDAALAATAADVDRLDALLDDQHYRLAYWRAASRDLGYRRFFDINSLIGLRVELPEVFEATHELPLRWVSEGRVQGLRIDHPDGLRDPAGYYERLRAAAPEAWIVAEKILGGDEALRDEWPIDGTTGYGFANLATGLLVAPAAEPAFDAAWRAVAGDEAEWQRVAAAARWEVLATTLGSDENLLADLFVAVCEANRRYRDFTRHELHHAVREMAAAMPVYRTYVRPGEVSDEDRRVIEVAGATATERRPDLDPELFGFLAAILRLEVAGPEATEMAIRFQQLTPAAMAKGIEDTAFYRHHRLVALNEVGGDPGRFGTPAAAFHRSASEADARWPLGMLALSTHDTKRSADVRARLTALTHDPSAWAGALERLRDAARPHRAADDKPSASDELLLLQSLIGAWPVEADRVVEYMRKATREAKQLTSWTDPDPAYDEAVERLVRGALADRTFVAALEQTVGAVREAGWRASLAQLALQLTAPGIPDTYQGDELWNLSLVDPDNRRPVDFEARRRLLAEVKDLGPGEAWAHAEAGTPKLWLMHRLLDLRRRRPDAFAPGAGYRALGVAGEAADAMVGFERGGQVVTVVPLRGPRSLPECRVELPGGRWRDLEGRERHGTQALDDLLAAFPVAVLEREA